MKCDFCKQNKTYAVVTIAEFTVHACKRCFLGRDFHSRFERLHYRHLTKHAPDVAKDAAQKGVLRKNRSGKRAGVA
jgi:hypothetical protein